MENSWHESQPEFSSLDSVTAPPKVFATPELLEMVLCHLPILDLLICQRINRTWRSVIMGSNSLQEKLFYKCDQLDKWGVEIKGLEDVELNPVLLHLQTRLYDIIRNSTPFADGLGKLNYPKASWKKMYVSRPALWKIRIPKKVRDSSSSELLTPMNPLRESGPKACDFVHFLRTNGVRLSGIGLEYLQELDLRFSWTLDTGRLVVGPLSY